VDIDYPETTVEFDHQALLPQWYVRDNVERLNLYRRLARVDKLKEIEEWSSEVEDRFGKIPEEAQTLIQATRIKLLASRLLFTKVTLRSGRIWLLCPSADTESGKLFYGENRMQRVINEIQELGKDVNVAQKDQAIRIIVKDIPDLPACITLLEELQEKFPAPGQALEAEAENV
jgi:transcription-repair coupling factor (superfamily II helicase)